MTAIYKWLPIVFGCHCRQDRSFCFHNRQLPICARCTGEAIGILLGLSFAPMYLPPVYILFLLMMPMVVDGVTQLTTSYESKNWIRCATGIVFGYALATVSIVILVSAYNNGYTYGIAHQNK